jgi:hypothetical protein
VEQVSNEKSDLSKHMLKFLDMMIMEGHPMKCIHMDNAVENKSFREAAVKHGDGEKSVRGEVV